MLFSETKYGELSGTTYKGTMDVNNSGVTSLKGCPEVVKGNFYCSGNLFRSLEFSPKTVTGDFLCNSNSLVSTKGFPINIGKSVHLKETRIKELVGLPDTINGSLDFQGTRTLKSLKGCPTLITGNLGLIGTGFRSKEEIFNEIIINKINVLGHVQYLFGDYTEFFSMKDVTISKMGKFKDLLDI